MANKLSRSNLAAISELPLFAAAPDLRVEVEDPITGAKGYVPLSEITGTSVVAFAKVQVGATLIEAETAADTLVLTSSGAIALTPDAGTDSVDIGAAAGVVPNLDALPDVAISSPAAGHALLYSGSLWVNQAITIAGVSGLTAALAGKSDTTHTHAGVYAPVVHQHGTSDISGLGTSAVLNVPATGDAAAAEVVKGSDTRLTNTRDPNAHSHPIAQIASGTANRLIGRDAGGNTAEIAAGSNVTIASGTISVSVPNAGIQGQYGGTPLGSVLTLNVTGAGAAFSVVSGVGTLNIPGGAGGGGVPAGGSALQYLRKISGQDGDVEWATLATIEARHRIKDGALGSFENQPNLIFDGFLIANEPTNSAIRVSPIEDGDAPIVVQDPPDAPVGGTWTPTLAGVAVACCEIAAPAGNTLTIVGPTIGLGSATGRIVKRLRVVNSLAGVLTLTFDATGANGFEIGGDLVTPDLTLDAGQTREFVIVNDGGKWFYGDVAGAGGGGAVSSVFGRQGVVVATSGDYTAAQVTETTDAKILTGTERTKLAGIEAGATADQTGSEIVSAINSELGSTTWQGGGGGAATLPFYASFDLGTASTPVQDAIADQYGIGYSTAISFGSIDMGTASNPAAVNIDLGASV